MEKFGDIESQLLLKESRTPSPSSSSGDGITTRSLVPSQSTEDRSTQAQDSDSQPPEIQTAAVSKPILIVAMMLLCVYLTVGILTYTSDPNQFTGTKTNRIVDSLYFCVVTLSTVGYGDIAPSTTKAKILTILLVSIGFFCLDYLLNRIVTHLLDLQEKAFLACCKTQLIVDESKAGRVKTSWKLCYAILSLVLCIMLGTLFLCYHEKLDLVDSVYLSVISVATVGYGDIAFETLFGRVFAVCWILLSSAAATSFFYYFAETKIGGSVMQLQMHMSDTKAELAETRFILSKLKEAEKITEEDIKLILVGYERSGEQQTA